MTRIPFPSLSGGLTPDDLPYGYSAFSTVFDDGRGYEPVAVGCEIDPSSRQVIIVALSPGAYVACTLVTAGQSVEQASEQVVRGFISARPPDALTCTTPNPGLARAPDEGSVNREAV